MVLPPSGPRHAGHLSDLRCPQAIPKPIEIDRIPPADEKSFRQAGSHGLRSIAGVCVSLGGTRPLVLKGSVTYHEAAPIAWLPAAFECPNDVPLFVAGAGVQAPGWAKAYSAADTNLREW